MGMRLFGRSFSSYDNRSIGTVCREIPNLPNPNPDNYTVIKYEHIGKHLVVMIKYHDCTNYEGKKILLYKDTNITKLKGQGSIDPHFTNNSRMISPVARFEPTTYGWDMAIKLAQLMVQK